MCLCDLSVVYWVMLYGLFVVVCVCLYVCVCLFIGCVRLLVNYCVVVCGLLCCFVEFGCLRGCVVVVGFECVCALRVWLLV